MKTITQEQFDELVAITKNTWMFSGNIKEALREACQDMGIFISNEALVDIDNELAKYLKETRRERMRKLKHKENNG